MQSVPYSTADFEPSTPVWPLHQPGGMSNHLGATPVVPIPPMQYIDDDVTTRMPPTTAPLHVVEPAPSPPRFDTTVRLVRVSILQALTRRVRVQAAVRFMGILMLTMLSGLAFVFVSVNGTKADSRAHKDSGTATKTH